MADGLEVCQTPVKREVKGSGCVWLFWVPSAFFPPAIGNDDLVQRQLRLVVDPILSLAPKHVLIMLIR